LTEVANVSFSAATTLTIDNVFTSAYDNYQMIFSGTNSEANNILAKFRTPAGVDTSDSTYGNIGLFVNSGNASPIRSLVNGSSSLYWASSGNVGTVVNAIISRPFLATPTAVYAPFAFRHSTIEIEAGAWSCVHNQSTSYGGLKITPFAGAITGNIRIYGYRNA
jgi:hypothetical protein